MKRTSITFNEYRLIDETTNVKMLDKYLELQQQLDYCKNELLLGLNKNSSLSFEDEEHLTETLEIYLDIKSDEVIGNNKYTININK